MSDANPAGQLAMAESAEPPAPTVPLADGGSQPEERRLRRRIAVWAVRAAAVGVFIGLWEWLGRTSASFFVPSFTATIKRLGPLATEGGLGEAEWASNQSLLIGFPIAAIAGIAIGLVLGRKRIADRAFGYYLDILLVVPVIAIVPVIIVALGLSLDARVLVVVIFALPVIALNARASVRIIDEPLVEMASSFEASRLQVWRTIILPASLGPIFTGLRIGLARAIEGMIVVELTLIPSGLGGLLINFKSEFASADLYATTLMILIEGLVLVGFAHMGERVLLRRLQGGGPE